jgi:hypothetical protein
MFYSTLNWQGPFPLAMFDFSKLPSGPGVYVFTESATPLVPNPPLPSESNPGYAAVMEKLRTTPCVLYVGRAKSLSDRLRGYRFKPYLEIVRRPVGSPPRHEADRHKGRALLHAQQYFQGPIYLRWAQTAAYVQTEVELIWELHPVLNTIGLLRFD